MMATHRQLAILLLVLMPGFLSAQTIQEYAVCIACYSEWSKINIIPNDPCSNLRSTITKALNSKFTSVLNSIKVKPYTPSWIFELPFRRDLSQEDEEHTGDIIMSSTNTTSERQRELPTTPTCRSLCSTYPDCSAWCPSSKRRRELRADDNMLRGTPSRQGNHSDYLSLSSEQRDMQTDAFAVQIQDAIEAAALDVYFSIYSNPFIFKLPNCISSLLFSKCDAHAIKTN